MKAKVFFSIATVTILLALFNTLSDLPGLATVEAVVSRPTVVAQNTQEETSDGPLNGLTEGHLEAPSENEEGSRWFITGEDSLWQDEEMDQVQQVVSNTLTVLARVGIDGDDLLEGYRFRRFSGEHVDGDPGLVGKVNHNKKEIVLSDTAFLRLGGFYIYHEIGHAVDFRLDRLLSQGFHGRAGSEPMEDGNQWQTADGFWLRHHGRDDREEAAADAFALWVLGEAGSTFKPVFPGTPVGTEYEAIAHFVQEVMVDLVVRDQIG
jgi:hypothetical protein